MSAMSHRGAHIRHSLQARAMHALALLLCVTLMQGGCWGQDEEPWESFQQDRSAVFSAPEPLPQTEVSTPTRKVVRLHVTSIQLPLGAASGREDLWRHLNVGSVPEASRDRLESNGIRLGVARRDGWSRFADALNELGARTMKTSAMVVVPGRPITIPIGRSDRSQVVFTFRNDGTLEGTDLPPGDTALSLGLTLGAGAGGPLRVSALPQLRRIHDRTRFVKEGQGYALRSTPDVLSLYPLAWEVTLTERDFFVIGPGEDSRRSSSPGRHFLLHEFENRLFETLLVFAPRMDTARGSAAGAIPEAGALRLPPSRQTPAIP
jgi:hypothetical protein